ncbi:MAG TPA: proton-conducting transporter membrane subunit [Methanocella sp.]|jgi:formate hydrogenlyase subunit 3/multisubunit Na+/H+ antiporter MnhD subunit
MYEFLALSPVILPVIGALIALVIYERFKDYFEPFIVGYSALLFIFDLAYLLMLQSGKISEPLAYGFIVLDAPGMLISCLVSFLGTLVMFYSFTYKDRATYDSTYFVTYMILMGVMAGLANTYNVIVMLVLLEAATVFSGVLILFGRTKRAINATTIYLAISIIEVLLVLYGAFILYNHTGSLDVINGISQIPEGDRMLLVFLFLFGFGTKAGVIPLSLIWLPPAHAEAPPPISATMSGILVKAGVIAMAKAILPFASISGAETISQVIVTIGVLGILVGVIMALLQEDLKRLLAYHTVSQIGYILVGIGIGFLAVMGGGWADIAREGVFGALFHITNHMLFKGGLFLISGALIMRVSTRKMHKMGGLLKQMPVTAVCFLIASLAMSGIPLLNGALSKEAIRESTTAAVPLWSGYEWIGWLQVLGSILTFICLIHAFYVIFMGKPKDEFAQVKEAPLYMLIPIVIMAGLCIVIGLFPGPFEDILRFAADGLLHMGA